MFYLYVITNTINGKIYIGKTSDRKGGISNRLREHFLTAKSGDNKYLYRSIRKYGNINFTITEINKNESEQYILKHEIILISLFNTRDKKIGYNNSKGGEGASGFQVGEKSSKSIFTNQEAENIIKLYISGGFTADMIAKKYNVKNSIVNKIIRGKTYYHVFEKLNQTEKDKINIIKDDNNKCGYIKSGIKKAFLKEHETLEIYNSYFSSNFNMNEICSRFNISNNLVMNILLGNTWKHLKLTPIREKRKINKKIILTKDNAVEIIYLFKINKMTIDNLSKMFHVRSETVSKIISGKTWPDLVTEIYRPSSQCKTKLKECHVKAIHFLGSQSMIMKDIAYIFNTNVAVVREILKCTNFSYLNLTPVKISNPVRKIEEHNVIEIFKMYSDNISKQKIVEQYNINIASLNNILSRRTWSQINIPKKYLNINSTCKAEEKNANLVKNIFYLNYLGMSLKEISIITKRSKSHIVNILHRTCCKNINVPDYLI